jgi:hypothetical protein
MYESVLIFITHSEFLYAQTTGLLLRVLGKITISYTQECRYMIITTLLQYYFH